ncbi:MFS transporter [Paracoccus aminophilus]|nr:MFS transporter [Paracoccus aminophilus]
METTPAATASRRASRDEHHDVSPSDLAVGVIIGRTSEFFDFFAFAIAAVLVFPTRLFPFLPSLQGVLWSFVLLAVAFVARPFGMALFSRIDRRVGRLPKLTIALFLMGTCTVGMGLAPTWQSAGWGAIVVMTLLRIGQGIALGGAWDGLASLLAVSVSRERRGFYAMIPQIGAPIGLAVAALLFAFLVATLSAQDFLEWGWRYPFFVAFALNVVALFARLRIVAAPEIERLFEENELKATSLRATVAKDGRGILVGIFVPLATFAMFHMVTVFPLSWIYLYTRESLDSFLILEAIGAGVCLVSLLLSGLLADRIGRHRILLASAIAIGIFALAAPQLLSMGRGGEVAYMLIGFTILGFSFALSSGAIASLFDHRNRYTASALVSSLSWMFGAGFAPLTALLLSSSLGLWAAGLYLLSGAVATVIALIFLRQLRAPGRI